MRRRWISTLFVLASTAAAQQYPFISVANSPRNIFFRAYGDTYLIFWFVQRDRQPQRQRGPSAADTSTVERDAAFQISIGSANFTQLSIDTQRASSDSTGSPLWPALWACDYNRKK
jgi:hypothetical protein